jgi:hypothetical protein
LFSGRGVTGLNAAFLSSWSAWLTPRIQQARRIALLGGRRIATVVLRPKLPPKPGTAKSVPEQKSG